MTLEDPNEDLHSEKTIKEDPNEDQNLIIFLERTQIRTQSLIIYSEDPNEEDFMLGTRNVLKFASPIL